MLFRSGKNLHLIFFLSSSDEADDATGCNTGYGFILILFLCVARSIIPPFTLSSLGKGFVIPLIGSLFLNLLNISYSYFLPYCFSIFCSLIKLSRSLPSCSAERFFSRLSISLTAEELSNYPLLSSVIIFLGYYDP